MSEVRPPSNVSYPSINLQPGDPLAILAHQLFWAAALFALGRLALARGTRRLVVQGG